MTVRIGSRILVALLIALAIQATPLFAQVKSSAITGTVTDPSGAVLADAAVTVTEQATNTTTTTKSDSKGIYAVPYLPIGHYTLTVTTHGFTTFKKTDINLASATTVRADVSMTIGSTESTVEVRADALALQTESAQVSGAISTEQIKSLPNITGNALYFATLEPGVVSNPQQLNSQALGVGYMDRRDMSGMRINGGQVGSNDIQLDGTSIQGSGWHETAVLPNPDALSEVRVTTNNFTADIGLAQGVVQETTKSGANEFHGDLNFMLRNEDLNANSFANKHQGVGRPTYRLLQGGGAVGGPVIIPKLYNGKNKLFFFGSFLRLVHNTSVPFFATVPTALERNGDFSHTMVKGNSGQPVNVNLYNPFSATPVTGSGGTLYQRAQYANAVVTNPSPGGIEIMNGFPLPNNGSFNGPNSGIDAYGTNNYYYAGLQNEARDSFNGRIDFKPSSNQSIYVTGGISKGYIINPNNWNPSVTGSPFVSQTNQGNINDSNPYGAIGDTIILNPTTVLDLHYGVTHISTSAQVTIAKGDPGTYGMPSFVSAESNFPGALPELGAVAPYAALNNNSFGNKSEHQLNHTVNGSLSKQIGASSLKFGGEYRVYLANYADYRFQAPTLAFSGTTLTNVTGSLATAGGANSSQIVNNQDQGFLPASIVTGAWGWTNPSGTAEPLALASKYFAIYAQDSWRPTKKLLLSFGIRYEGQPGPTERYNRMSSYDVNQAIPFASSATGTGNLGLLIFPGKNGHSRNLYETQWNNVSPRFGATYQLSNNTVVRGGFGRNYLPSNTGFNAQVQIFGSNPYSDSLNPAPFGLSPNGVAVGTFDQGTSYVTPAAGPVQSPNNYGSTGALSFDNLYGTGHTDQWNFFIERQLTPTWLVNGGYIGSSSANLPWRSFPMNGTWAVPPATLAAFRAGWIASNGATNPANARVPNPIPALIGHASGASGGATITALQAAQPLLALLGANNLESRGSSAYNALVVKVQHSASHGLSVGANYTWSKTTGIVGGSSNQSIAESQQGNSSGPTGGVDYVNLKNNHSLVAFDVANRFVLNGTYDLPFGKGKLFGSKGPIVDWLIGGWQIAGVVVLQGGNPWGPDCSTATGNTGTINGRCIRVPGQPLELPASQQRYYNGKEALTLPDGHVITPAVNTFMRWNPDAWTEPLTTMANGKVFVDQYQSGSTPMAFGSMRTPGVENVNLAVVKAFRITERYGFELHANATNALNHHNPYVLNNVVSPITSTSGADNSAPGENSNTSFGSYGLVQLENRQITLQANFTF